MTCLARAHARSEPPTRVHHLLVTASRTLTRRGTFAGQNVLVLDPIYTRRAIRLNMELVGK